MLVSLAASVESDGQGGYLVTGDSTVQVVSDLPSGDDPVAVLQRAIDSLRGQQAEQAAADVVEEQG